MRKRILLWMMATLLMVVLSGTPTAGDPCDPYAICNLRGDVLSLIAGFGVIEITPPDEFVYTVIDGAVDPQQFAQIKARLRNRVTDRTMGAGTVTAMARYRLRTDYQNDLSSDPPTLADVQKDVTVARSAPVDVTAISSYTPLELEFDFSANPIPAGITDLYFLVLFQGEIEGVEGMATAIGVKDLNEPQHLTTWNNTDWFLVNYQLRTGQDIRNDPELERYVIDNCMTVERFIDPLATDEYIGFTADRLDTPVFVVHYQALAPGRFGRALYIADADSYYLHRRSVTINPNSELDFAWEIPGTTNAMNPAGFHTTELEKYRQIYGHINSAWIWTCPFTGYSAEIFDESSYKSPADTAPVPVTTITFP